MLFFLFLFIFFFLLLYFFFIIIAAHLLSQAEIVKAPPQLRSNNERDSGDSTPSKQFSAPVHHQSEKGRNAVRKKYGDSGYYDEEDDDGDSVDRFLPSIRPPMPKNKQLKSSANSKKNSAYNAARLKVLDAERRRDKGRADARSDDEGRGRSRSRSPNGGGRTDDSYNHNLRVSTSPSLDPTPGKILTPS